MKGYSLLIAILVSWTSALVAQPNNGIGRQRSIESDSSLNSAAVKSENCGSKSREPEGNFAHFQVFVGVGLPYGVNVGGKYRFSQSVFIELETQSIVGIRNGYSFLALGLSTTNHATSHSSIFVDGEMAVLLGGFPAAGFISPRSGTGAGLSLRGDIETGVGLSLFMKLGVAKYFSDIYGAGVLEVGLSLNI